MKFEVIDSKPWHVGQMLRAMRTEHKNAIQALGINAAHDLRWVFASSSFRKSWMIDGKLAAIGGLIGTLASSEGHLWLVVSEHAVGFGKDMVREARRQVAALRETHTELTTTIFEGDETARKFAAYLGFRECFGRADGLIKMIFGPAAPTSNEPFIIFGLPRSRTTWLSHFLSYEKWSCVHDAMLEANGFDGIKRILSAPNVGICETGFMVAWPLLKRHYPKARFVVIRRPIEAVKQSLAEHHWEFMPGHLEWMATKLDEISALPNALTVDFDEIDTRANEIFEFCLREAAPKDWVEYWLRKDVQIDMSVRLKRLGERAPMMSALIDECMSLMSPVSFQVEPWKSLHRDGQELFEEHRLEVGSFQGLPFDLDVDRAQTLDDGGHLQIMTARAGQKIVGYLVFIIDRHPESRRTMIATQNTFFVSKPYRGIGPKFHATALGVLKDRGVKILSMSAGVRGSGPKLAHLYKRLGAIEERRVFSLRIG